MKKIVFGGIVVSLALFLTGCGKGNDKNIKTLVCTQNVNEVNIELSIDFDDKMIDDMRINYNMNLSDYDDLQIDAIKKQDFCTIVKNAMLQFEDGFTNCKQDVSDKMLFITSRIDVNKTTDNNINEENDIEETKDGIETEGYTCVIK